MAAIYQWFVQNVQVLTTTLYPIEVLDAIQMSCQLGPGPALRSVPTDDFDTSTSFISMGIKQLLKTTGPYDNEYDSTTSFVSMEIRQLLKITGPYDDIYDSITTMVSVSLSEVLVTIDTPDEALEFAFELETINCSMTPV